MRDLRQSDAWAEWMRTLGWDALVISTDQGKVSNYLYLRRLGIFGSVAKLQRPEGNLDLEQINQIIRKEKSIFIKVEPDAKTGPEQLVAHGYIADKWALGVTRTITINLNRREEVIYNAFDKDCRYEIRKSLELGLVTEMLDFGEFYLMLRRANGYKKLWTYPERHLHQLFTLFGTNVFTIGVRSPQNREVFAGCMVLISDRKAYYFMAGSLPEGKKMHAHYLTVWEAIREAQRRKCELWDFEGIYDPRYSATKAWKGFTHFKQCFGGEEVVYPGSFTLYRNPFVKMLSRFMN